MLVLAVVLVVIAVIQVVCVLALIDQYRGLLQIRANLGLIDVTKAIDLPAVGARVAPSSVGLPRELDHEALTVVAFLSTKCSTCRTIAEELQGHVRKPLWVIVEGPSAEACSDFLAAVGLSGSRIGQDVQGEIAQRLDLRVAPAALIFLDGQLARALSLPSARQLKRILSQPTAPTQPVNVRAQIWT